MLARMWRNWNPPTWLVGTRVIQPLCKQSTYLLRCRTEFPYNPSLSPSGYIPHRIKVGCPHKHLYRNVHSSSPYTSVGEGKQPRCPSTDEAINIMLYMHMREHYSAIKEQSTPTLFSLDRPGSYLRSKPDTGTACCIAILTRDQCQNHQ